MRVFKRVVFTALSLVAFLFATAQEKGTLTGVVISKEDGLTVIGANVVWVTDRSVGSPTDLDGKYTLSLPAGEQTVEFSAVGLGNQTKTVTIEAGKTTTLNITLSVQAQEMGAVVVSAGKFEQKVEDLTVSVEIINPSLVENKGTVNAQTAIEQTPGVTIVDSEPQIRSGSGYSFGAGSRVQILVDDLPMLSGDAGRPSWGFIPVENLEQIEVIKGASSVLYGSAALNGIINIRTAYPKAEPQTKINYQIGAYSAPNREAAKWWTKGNPIFTNLNFFHSRKIGNLDIVIGGSGLLDDGHVGPALIEDTVNNTTYFPESGTFTNVKNNEGTYEKRGRINGNIRYRSKKHEGLSYGVNFNYMRSRSKGSLLWMDSDTNIYRPFPGSDTETKQTTFNIDPFLTIYGRVNHNRHSIRTRVFHQNNDNDNNQANLNYVYFGEYQFQRRVKSINGLTITAGGMGQFSQSEAPLYQGDPDGDGKNQAMNFAAYGQIDKKFWDKLNLSLGVRYEYFKINDEQGQGQPVFRSGLSYKVLKETYLRASFGQGFRFPTIAERFIRTTVGGMNIFPSDNLDPEKSFSVELGIKQGLKVGKFFAYLDVAGFMQQYQNTIEFTFGKWGTDSVYGPSPFNPNQIIYDPIASISRNIGFRSVNTGSTRVTGIDISLLGQGKFNENFGLNVLAGYTYTVPVTLDPHAPFSAQDQRAVEDDLVTNYVNTSLDTTNNILKYRFQHLVKCDLELTIYDFAVGFSVRYYSYMQNVDKIFYDLDEGDLGAIVNFDNIGIVNWRGDEIVPGTESNPSYNFGKNKPGDWVADGRISYNIGKTSKIAFIVNNIFNREYAVRPLAINAPRTTSLQYTLKF